MKKNIKLNALSITIVRILNIVFPLITSPYISRILNKTSYGTFNVSNVVINLFIPFASLGIYKYGIREVSKVKDDREALNKKFSELFYISIFSTLLTTSIYYLYIFNRIEPDLLTMYSIMGIQIFAQMFYIEWLNEAFENYTFILYKTLLIRILMLVGIFTLVKTEHDIIAYTLVMSVTTLINYLLSFLRIKKEVKFVKVEFKDLKKLVKPLLAMLLMSNANILYTTLDQIFISRIGLPEQVTYYVIGYNLATLLVGILTGAISVSMPRLGYYLGKDDKEAYENLVYAGNKALSFFMIPMCIGLAIIGTKATLIYGGEKYLFAGICTSLFAIRSIGWGTEIILGTQVIMVNGYEQRLTLLYFICGALNLILNLILYLLNITLPEYYIVTTIISEGFLIYLEYRLIKNMRLINASNIFKTTFKYIIISLGFIPLSYIINKLIPFQNIVNKELFLNTTITIMVCGIYYLIILYLVKDDMLKQVMNMVKKLKITKKMVN